ncbi:MAG: hypothetical protein KF770_10625 [Anaerolineae bacterium]|nr:hypothetical protein [Anaerolineae bacterium]
MSYWITTSDRARSQRWERIFGADRLPVLSAAARRDVVEGQERPCYDLALGQLSTWQRDRLAAYASRRTGRPYEMVRCEIEAAISWPVTAAGCQLVCEEDMATAERPSPFLLPAGWGRGVRIAKRLLSGRGRMTGIKIFRFFRFLP